MAIARAVWEPPAELTRENIVHASNKLLAQPDRTVTGRDFEFRLDLLGYAWDIGGKVFEPETVAVGPDGKLAGCLRRGHAGDVPPRVSGRRLHHLPAWPLDGRPVRAPAPATAGQHRRLVGYGKQPVWLDLRPHAGHDLGFPVQLPYAA